MDFVHAHLLTLILFTPALSAVVLFCMPPRQIQLLRWFALLASLIPLGLALALWIQFRPAAPGYQFEEQYSWYAAVGSSLHLGVDGLSLTMVFLTTLLTPLAILASFTIT